jgi:cyclophilin family peptidyl-prolyl cis-trans isomerase
MRKILLISIVVLAGCIVCKKKEPEVPPAETGPFGLVRNTWTAETTPQHRIEAAVSVKDTDIKLTGGETAVIETNKGTFKAELYSTDAPNTVRNFIRLAQCGFWDGLVWYRLEPGFVLQGGSPQNSMVGNAGYLIPFEANDRKHELGAMGMGRGADLNSASCQFYITLAPQPGLDGSYVVFGKVTQGMDVVNQIAIGDSILKISVIPGNQ